MPINYIDVARSKIQQALYSNEDMDFTRKYDSMYHYPLSYYLPWEVVCRINKLVTSLKYSDKVSYKKKEIANILYPFGFRKFASGTNRITFRYLDDRTFLIKVALDKVGMTNNPDEYVNSIRLKPFLPKVFDVTPCGTISLVERVQPVTCLTEAKSIAADIFDLINYRIIGKYVAADIGTKFYLNWGVRYGFGPVILDLTDLYELDGNKLYCNQVLSDGSKCGGEIDYDDGFNNLICNKCFHVYEARALAKQIETGHEIIKGGTHPMSIQLIVNGEVVKTSEMVSDNILPRASRKRKPTINFDPKVVNTGMRLVIGDQEINNCIRVKETKPETKDTKAKNDNIVVNKEIMNTNVSDSNDRTYSEDSAVNIQGINNLDSDFDGDIKSVSDKSEEYTHISIEETSGKYGSVRLDSADDDVPFPRFYLDHDPDDVNSNTKESVPLEESTDNTEESTLVSEDDNDIIESTDDEGNSTTENNSEKDTTSQEEFMSSEGNDDFSDYFSAIREGKYETKGAV